MTPTTIDIASLADATPSGAYNAVLEHIYAGIRAAFAEPTGPASETEATSAASAPRTTATTIADPGGIADLSDAPELRAVEELRSWLHLSNEQVARATGLTPSLIYHWRKRYRTGHSVRPRASTVETLWRVHALVRAIAEALEGAEHNNAVRLWFRDSQNGITPLELLFARDDEELERRARALLFDQTARTAPAWRVAAAEDDADLTSAPARPAPVYDDNDFA